jgi:hypothetical protein
LAAPTATVVAPGEINPLRAAVGAARPKRRLDRSSTNLAGGDGVVRATEPDRTKPIGVLTIVG